jgi:uncharacterized protein (DUF1697 family)
VPRFVALFRGINVGKGKRVPVTERRKLLVEPDYRNIPTLRLPPGWTAFDEF